jgi:quercetin dioxygenase-like cupin family protein
MTVVSGDGLRFADLPGRRSADPFPDLPGSSSVRIVRMTYAPGRTAHRHPVSEEVVFVAAGHGSVWLEGEQHPVTAGDVVRIPAGAAHATIPDPGVEMELVCFFPHPRLTENIEETQIAVTDREEEER